MVYVLYTRQFAYINAYRLFLSAHSDGMFWALLVFWDKQPGTSHERDVLLRLEQFVSDTEDGALAAAAKWASEKYNKVVEFVEV